MADAVVSLRWTGEGLVFRGAGQGGPEVVLDGDRAAGPSPMQALLLALATCMGADVVDMLAKMRVPLAGLAVRVEGDRAPAPPRRFLAIRLRFEASGTPADAREKVARAVELSKEKYCSVLHTLRKDVVVESDVALL